MWTKRMMFLHYSLITVSTLASNLCITTKRCEYILYPDGVTVFYNLSNPGAALHNKIVDLGIQPFFIVSIVLLYVVTGVKVIRIRRQLRLNKSRSDVAIKKRRNEIMLVVQGFLISAPQLITALAYHIQIYVALSGTLKVVLNFIISFASKLVYASSPFLYLALNVYVRAKVAALLASGASVGGPSAPAGPMSVSPATAKFQSGRKIAELQIHGMK